jgi:hypothetical protein
MLDRCLKAPGAPPLAQKRMATAHGIVLQIIELMDGRAWDRETVVEIANLIAKDTASRRRAGLTKASTVHLRIPTPLEKSTRRVRCR